MNLYIEKMIGGKEDGKGGEGMRARRKLESFTFKGYMYIYRPTSRVTQLGKSSRVRKPLARVHIKVEALCNYQ